MIKLIQHNQKLKELIHSASISLKEKAIDLDTYDQVLRECMSINEMREAGSF